MSHQCGDDDSAQRPSSLYARVDQQSMSCSNSSTWSATRLPRARAPDVSWSCIGLDAFRELCPSAQHLLVPCATQHYPSRGSICLKTDRSVGATTSPQQPGSKVLRGPVVLAPLLPFAVHLAAQHPTSHPQNPKLKQEILLKNSAQAPLACVFLRSGGGVVLLSCALLRSSLCSYP